MGPKRRNQGMSSSNKLYLIGLLLLNVLLVVQCSTSADHDNAKVSDAHSGSNDSHHENETAHHGNGTHHGIHVASWNFEYVKPYLTVTIFLIVAAICKLGFHKAEILSSIVPESCLLILLGTVVGAILQASGFVMTQLHLSSSLFFLILLPPIILESAYSLHDRVFFDNLGTILLYAVIGTIVNCFLLALCLWGLEQAGAMGTFAVPVTLLHFLLFSSLIVAVDPVAVLAIFQEIGVNNVLYFLVFGESLLNDAVTVVIYNTMKTFNQMETIPASQVVLGFVAFFTVSLGGLIIGILYGMFSSFLTKYTHDVKVVEPLAIFTLAYASYLTAELFHFSGIISIIGCGLVQVQYAFHNISSRSYTTITYFSKTMSTTCDCIIFMFLGLALVRDSHEWHTGFILWTLLLCLVLRFLVVYSLTFLANKLKRVRKIDMEEQFIMAYGGLRGAVAFSLAAMLDRDMCHKELFITATLAVVIFTVFIQGSTIKPLVKLLRIKKTGKKLASMYQEISAHVTDHMMAGIEEVMGRYGHNAVREIFSKYDSKYLKIWLQRNPETREESIMHLYNKMAMQIHYDNLRLGGAPDMSQSFDNGSQLELYPCPPSPQAKPSMELLVPQIDPGSRKPSLQDARRPSLIPLDRLKMLAEQAKQDDFDDEYMSGEPGSMDVVFDKSRQRQRGLSIPQPSIRRRHQRAFSEENEDRPMSMDEETMRKRGRRSTLFNVFNRSIDTDQDIKANDLHKLFLKNPQNYRQRYDKNLKRDEDHDLLHLLIEKRNRTARLRRASMMSPTESMAGDRDLTAKNFLSEPNTPKRHTTLNVIREGEAFDFSNASGQSKENVNKDDSAKKADKPTVTVNVIKPASVAYNNGVKNAGDPVKVNITQPSKSSPPERTPLLQKLTSDDSVFLPSDTSTDHPESTQDGDNNDLDHKKPSSRRAHLIRQDDFRGRSESPPSTPPVGDDTHVQIARTDSNSPGPEETEL